MAKKLKRTQKFYKMKGCSKKNKTKRHLGGGLAYTGKHIATQSNPFLAYTGKGGGDNITLKNDIMSPNIKLPSNPYGANPALPNTGPEYIGNSTMPTNMGSLSGGSCGCSNVMKGGSCGCSNVMKGGSCGCGVLNGGKRNKQKGGRTLDPQGLVGAPWGASPAKWPGVDGVDGNRNYLAYNDYKVDPLTALINVGANRPFLYGGRKKQSKGRRKRINKRKTQRGGVMSNLLTQDFVNLGRQVQYGIGSTYNALNGYAAPTPVLPWQGQLPRTPNLNTMRGTSL